MARRRLTPIASPFDVPHAEHPRPAAAGATAPIAHVAADAAATAAAEELARALATARETGRLVLDLPHAAIAADHLTRDRLPAEDEEMAALKASLAAHGQRSPIEVSPLAGDLPYGLISGWRRLAALKALHAETGEARFATIQALVRRPETLEEAYVAMVEENEIRVGLSPYERARVAALATRRGVFASEKAALLALFATASRPKRSRIRAFLELYHALDAALSFPAHLPERLGLALVEAIRAGRAEALAAALTDARPDTPEAERAVLEACLRRPRTAAGPAFPPSPRPVRSEPCPGVVLQEALDGPTPVLTLKGPGVTPALAARIRALLMASARGQGEVQGEVPGGIPADA